MPTDVDPARFLWCPADYFAEQSVADVFPHRPKAPLEVDLGCGDGSFLVEMASRFPERSFLGVERLLGRVRKTARKAAQHPDGLLQETDNLRVIRLDSAYLAGWLVADAAIDRFHLLFPDPWPKKRHHKHRFVRQEDFHRALRRKLKLGGLLCFKTDDEEYFAEAVEILDGLPFLRRRDWPEDEFYAQTDFERQWREAGKTIDSGCWERV